MTLTKRCILLINEQSVPSLEKITRKSYEFYTLHSPENIKPINLFYNDLTEKLFQNLKGIIASNRHQSIALTTLLYGPSGTGKTEFVYQLAKKTNATVIHADYSKIISKWIGESEKNLSQLFYAYETLSKSSNRPTILLLNEADALINKRVIVHQSNDVFANQIQAQLLELLENFKGILIATTNIEENMDKAFERRFLFKSKIDYPTIEVKEQLIQNSKLKQVVSDKLLKQLIQSNWSPAQLVNYEQKIELLTEMNKLNEKEIETLLIEDGLLTVNNQIGYS
jgi:SpoVK/Ycf46/Vps4 family AAA+-type ATPase